MIYQLDDDAEPSLVITRDTDEQETVPQLALNAEDSASLFRRDGRIRQLKLVFGAGLLFKQEGVF